MCISHSVGLKGINHAKDVRMVQALLNENILRLIPLAPLDVDGSIGNPMKSATIGMIGEFQRRVLGQAKPDMKVDPGGRTLTELRAGMSAGLTKNKLLAIMSNTTTVLVERYFQWLVTMMANNQINNPLRIAHFLAQMGEESGDLRWAEELDSGDAYNGRVDLGNTQPGDGPRFKGRGLLQLTGRNNYTSYGTARNRDFLTEPNNLLVATDPSLAVDSACWYWATLKNLNPLADADNVGEITYRINGAYDGPNTHLDDRKAHLARAKCLLVP